MNKLGLELTSEQWSLILVALNNVSLNGNRAQLENVISSMKEISDLITPLLNNTDTSTQVNTNVVEDNTQSPTKKVNNGNV